MQNITMGAIAVLSLAALGYTTLVDSDSTRPKAPVPVAMKRSPQDIAARDRMARLVAEVAARSAAQTAKSVAMSRMQASRPPQAVEQKTASR